MSKIALLLFGISYLDNYQHWHPNKLIYNIDWKYSFENYQNFIIQYFQKKEYQVDIFLVSNKIDEIAKKLNKPLGFHVIDSCYQKTLEKINKGYCFLAFSIDFFFLGDKAREEMKLLKSQL